MSEVTTTPLNPGDVVITKNSMRWGCSTMWDCGHRAPSPLSESSGSIDDGCPVLVVQCDDLWTEVMLPYAEFRWMSTRDLEAVVPAA